jgi:opacity protein-like surface antigen
MKLITLSLFIALSLFAQLHELGFQLGRMNANGRELVRLGSGTSFQFNYGYRIANLGKTDLYGEVHFLANPQRIVGSGIPTATRDVATIFLTPGLKLKLLPSKRVSPYVSLGAGWAVFEQSTSQLNGAPNSAPRTVNRGVLGYGGGVDWRLVRRLGLRAEIRDFYSGSPAYNIASLTGGQHNVVVSGGFVIYLR